mgnify:CR=1 FL=1
MPGVEHKSIIITGGAGEIAQEAARQCLAGGAQVLLVDIDEAALQAAIEALGSDNASHCVADVTSEDDTRAYVAEAVSRHGGVDVLLANAGIEGPVAPAAEYDTAMFDKVMAVNVRGVFLGVKHVFPVMAEGGGGSIVITSSVAGVTGSPGICAYNTSKHAVIGLMRSVAKEGGPLNIRVNTVNPAPIEGRRIASLESGMSPEDPAAVREGMVARITMQRYGLPTDVANLMLFLAAEESQYLTGGVYMVDGGMTH